MPFDFGDQSFDIHSTTSVNCVVIKGDSPVKIEWLFNGRRIRTNDGLTIANTGQKMSLMFIESIQPRHAGNYTCIARNNAGSVEHTSLLKVIGKIFKASNPSN